MIKKRTLILVAIIFILTGYFTAKNHNQNTSRMNQIQFYNSNIEPTDRITLVSSKNIYTLTSKKISQITNNTNLMEPISIGNNFAAIDKQTNYSSLVEYDSSGNRIKTLFDGNADKIDNMLWISDPAVNANGDKIAYVSDQNRISTGIPDNALFILNLLTNKTSTIALPDHYSGGIAHPVWDMANPNVLLYDYYQYTPITLEPYSTIMEYDRRTAYSFPLTTSKQNVFQSALSPDGKDILFLLRNGNGLDVSMYVGNFTSNGIRNEVKLTSGDFAYPVFSNTLGYIYYLSAQGNEEYNLFKAKIVKNKLTDITPITTNANLQGNSSYEIDPTEN